MKKYIISILVASVFLIGTPFLAPKVSAADINMRDFVNLLIAIGVITPDKIPAVNAFLANLDHGSSTPPVAPTSTSSITVTSPNGGESYLPGQTINVTWSSTGLSSSTMISLIRIKASNGRIFNLATNTLNDGTETVTLPVLSRYESMYNSFVLEIKTYTRGRSVTYSSNSRFLIAAPSTPTITVTSPNGGETLNEGQQYTIRWNTIGLPSSQKLDITLDVPYFNSTIGTKIASGIPNTGVYSWVVESLQPFYESEGNSTVTPNGQYKITVVCPITDSNCNFTPNADRSDNYFTIAAPTASVTGVCGATLNTCTAGTLVDTADTNTNIRWSCSGSNGGSTASCEAKVPVNTTPSIKVVSPNGGESYSSQVKTLQINYTTANLEDSRLAIDLVDDSGNIINLASNQTNTGTYLASIPENITTGNYKVKIISWDKSDYATDSSDNYFTITAPVSVDVACTGYTYSDWSACVNGVQMRSFSSGIPGIPPGCTGGVLPVLSKSCVSDINTEDCNVTWPGTSIKMTGKNNVIGVKASNTGLTEPRFLCVNKKIYACGWESSSSIITKISNGSTAGNYTCSSSRVGSGKWLPTPVHTSDLGANAISGWDGFLKLLEILR